MIKMDIKIPKEELDKIHKLIGSTFLIEQRLEYSLRYILWLLSDMDFITFSKTDATNIMDNHSRKTLGMLINELQKHVELSGDFHKILKDGLDARNLFIHSYFTEKFELLISEEGRTELISKVKSMRNDLIVANNSLETYIDPLMEMSIIINSKKEVDAAEKKFLLNPLED